MELTEKPQSGHEYAETLLAAANKEQRGKLTVFLGAAAGVGKTCSMLQEAHARLREGTDVVLGLVLTHGRKETAALLEGLPRIPEQEIEYHGKMLQEMDLDAILRRRPQLVVVDELAHSNVPGSRHQRRYQDVEELLAAGIDVYTAVNIQHIESLNDVVAQITGSIVRETVPDAFFELADDIRLIDIPPKELLQRLKEGKVYRPQQAQQALRGFFRQGNISALRELALRFTARHVDQDMLAYMRLHKIEGPWPASGKVMVCVSASPFSAQLIRAAQRLAQGLHAEFLAVHIETPERRFPHGDKERERLWRNLNLAKELGGQILTTAGTDFVETVLQIAVRENVTAIVVGKSGPRRWYEIGRKTLVDRLIDRSGFIHVYVIQGREEEEKSPVITTAVPQQQAGWRQYVGALAAVVITTGLCYVFRGQLELVNISLLYLLPVLLTAAWWGRSTAYVTALFCVLGFDFLFLEPIFTFTIYDIRYLWSFLIFGLVAFLVGGKTESLRRELESTRRRESNVNSLYRFSSRIAALDVGADDYVTKPFGMGELMARMRVCLRRAGNKEGEPILTCGGLQLNLLEHRVVVEGREVKLTPTEYELLKVMLKYAGRVLTHKQLLKAVWGNEYDTDTHYIRIYMRQLRRKIEPDPAQPKYLITEAGIGYRLLGGE